MISVQISIKKNKKRKEHMKRSGDIISGVITGTFFLVINVLVTLGQYFFVDMSWRACVFFFVLTAILDYAVANIYIAQRRKLRLKYYRRYGDIFNKSVVGSIYIKLPRAVKGISEKIWFFLLRILLVQKIIDWFISHGYRHQCIDLALKKKKETIAFVADTKAMFLVYYVTYVIKLSLLLMFDHILAAWSLSGDITLTQYALSLILCFVCMLFGARILGIMTDLLKTALAKELSSFFERLSKYFKHI